MTPKHDSPKLNPSRDPLLAASMLSVFLLAAHLSASFAAEPASKPNILFIAVDDLRPELGCYGCSEIISPHIDRLAREGVTFNRAYCQQAVCNPSRASMLTGLRPDSTKVWDLVTNLRDTIPDAVTLPQHFKRHGYHAVGMGKIFHNTFPDPQSWTIAKQPAPVGYRTYSKETRKRLQRRREEARRRGMTERQIGNRIRGPAVDVEDVPDSHRFDAALADLALEHLQKLGGKKQPFFLGVGFILPHLPWTPPRKYFDLYDPAQIPLASNGFLPRGAPAVAFGDRSMGGMYELRDCEDFNGAPSPFEGSLTAAQQRRLKHGYYASVSFIDAQVGRLLDELKRLGLEKETIVVLWGDHGWKLGEHNGWCKQTNYEIDTRVPLIFRVPGSRANGQKTDALVELVDVYPTLCDLAGLPLPETLEGKSLRPLLDDPSATVKTAAFSQFPRRHEGGEYMGCTVRTDRYRYVEWQDRRSGKTVAMELYDHTGDPEENTNLASDPRNKEIIEQLNQQLWNTLRPPPNLTGATQKEKSAQAGKPNVVFFMADDWSWPHAGILGDPVVKTPNFDRVAREGMLFENAFVSTPSCTPSRFSILTGQHHWRLEEGDSLGGSLREEFDVYTEMLEAAGYRIGRYGKGAWPSKHTFRHRDCFGERFRSFDEFIKERRPGEPFCFWFGGADPHRPYQWQVGVDSGIKLEDVRVPACLPDHPTVRTDLADYYWEVQRFDREVGRVLTRLEAMGELDNTIIVVSGDNGMPFPRCKATLYDLGTRVPLAVRWGAKVKGNRTVEDFVSLCDFAPTFLEAAGLQPGKAMTGRSLLPILRATRSGQIDPARTYVLTGMERHVYPYPSRAIRTRDFLYIRNFDPAAWPT